MLQKTKNDVEVSEGDIVDGNGAASCIPPLLWPSMFLFLQLDDSRFDFLY